MDKIKNKNDVERNNQQKEHPKAECENCKKLNPFNSRFCTFCGVPMQKQTICSNCSAIFHKQIKYCPNCGFQQQPIELCVTCGAVTSQLNYCGKCGTPIIRQPLKYASNTSDHLNPPTTNYHGFATSPPYPFHYYRPRVVQTPKWWKLPIFFIIFSIFGLNLALLFAISIIAIFFSVPLNDPVMLLILDISTRFIELLLIIFAINYFTSMRNFWGKPLNSNIDSQGQDIINQKPKNKDKFKKNLIEIVVLFFFIVILLLIIDIFFSFIIFTLKDMLGISEPTSSPYNPFFGSTLELYIMFVLLGVIFAPIHEELLFRGFLQQALDRTAIDEWLHYAIQGFSFAFLHLPGDILGGGSIDFIFLHMISTGLFGIVATWFRKKFGSVIYPIILHSIANGSIFFINGISDNIQIDNFDFYLLIAIILLFFLTIIFLLLRGWRIKKPLFLKAESKNSTKSYQFIILAIILMVILTIIQYGFIFLNLVLGALYMLIIALISIILFILWGKKLIDITWDKFLFSNNKKIILDNNDETLRPPYRE